MATGICYLSNKKIYHKIRYQNDKLFKEQKLSVIDEYCEAYKRKYKTKGKTGLKTISLIKGSHGKVSTI